MIYKALRSLIPRPLVRHVKHFEWSIEQAVGEFAASLPEGARVLDAGAGETQHKRFFSRQNYHGIDLGIGDGTWDYSGIDVLGDLEAMPFHDAVFDAAINIVTLEHVRRPERVVCEMARVLRPGGRLLLIAPHEWEEHQEPHDYFRYTRYGLRFLLEQAGLTAEIRPVGGIFRLLSRRLFNAVSVLPLPLDAIFFVVVVIPSLLLPVLEPFDKRKNFTLGYICIARKPS